MGFAGALVLCRFQVGCVERRAQRPSEGDRVVDGPEMHVEQPRLFGQPVVVRLHDSDVAGAQRLDDLLHVRGVVARNPVPQGLSTRTPSRAVRGVPLIRTPRTLPRVIDPDEADALLGALRTHRDRAMVLAMLLGGLRRCEVLGLRLCDVRPGEKRLFIAEGKGWHQRIVPVSPRFFTTLASYLELERPARADGSRVRGAEGPTSWIAVERGGAR